MTLERVRLRAGPRPEGLPGNRLGRLQRRSSRPTVTRGEGRAGWLFVGPAVLVTLVFIVAPMLMALWASLLNWDGQSSPFGGNAQFVGLGNYANLLGQDTLLREDFSTSVRNTLYYVLLDVPLVTVLAFGLALVVNQQVLRGRAFFRTVFYFPSITSSVAIGVTFLFLFQGSGAVNAVLAFFGIHGPRWFTDSRGLIQILLTSTGLVNPLNPPVWLDTQVLSLSLWNWLAGPSVAMRWTPCTPQRAAQRQVMRGGDASRAANLSEVPPFSMGTSDAKGVERWVDRTKAERRSSR